jgi:hypothetical protein
MKNFDEDFYFMCVGGVSVEKKNFTTDEKKFYLCRWISQGEINFYDCD